MADSSSSDNSDPFGGITPAPDPTDPNSPWNYDWLNPYGNFVASLPDQMPGPLSLERINGPREFYTDPEAYFAMRPASDAGPSENDVSSNWARPMVEINPDSGGGNGVSDTSAAVPRQQAGPASDWDGTVGSVSGPAIVDDPNQAASLKTNAEVSLHPDLAGQIEQYAKNRGISVGQYAIDKDGNIGFYDPSGNFVLERPPVGTEFGKFWNDPSGATASNALSAAGNMGATHAREIADQLAATGAGALLGGPLNPVSVVGAAGAAAASDAALQALGNHLLQRPVGAINWDESADQALRGAYARFLYNGLRLNMADTSPFNLLPSRVQWGIASGITKAGSFGMGPILTPGHRIPYPPNNSD